MDHVKSALIVGGGIGGMATAIRLAELGTAVTLIDLDPEWRVYGAGITITGPTLRAYKRLGLIDQINRTPKVQSPMARASITSPAPSSANWMNRRWKKAYRRPAASCALCCTILCRNGFASCRLRCGLGFR